MDLWRWRRERRVRSVERLRRVAPVRKMVSWLWVRGVEVDGDCGISGLDMMEGMGVGEMAWRSLLGVTLSLQGKHSSSA